MKPLVPIFAAILLAPQLASAEGKAPSGAMIAAPEIAARFVETLDETGLREAFAARDVTCVDNFPPYVFRGPTAVEDWVGGLRKHLAGITELQHHFGPAQEFSQTGDHAYFSMPVTWTELYFGKPVTERGAWVFVMVRDGDKWRIQGSVWGRTETTPHH